MHSVVLLGLLLHVVYGAPVRPGLEWNSLRVLGYLQDVPSLRNLSASHQFLSIAPEGPVNVSAAVSQFQVDHGLPATGVLDTVTSVALTSPRCGVTPALWPPYARIKRFALTGSRWNKNYLTFNVTNYSQRYSREYLNTEISRAFAAWNSISNLKMYHANENQSVDITLLFATGFHGDLQPFFPSSVVLAHAQPPEFGGSVHINDYVDFNHTQLFVVLAHELGHALGLDHTNIPGNLMYPTYHPTTSGAIFGKEDLAGTILLYGLLTAAEP